MIASSSINVISTQCSGSTWNAQRELASSTTPWNSRGSGETSSRRTSLLLRLLGIRVNRSRDRGFRSSTATNHRTPKTFKLTTKCCNTKRTSTSSTVTRFHSMRTSQAGMSLTISTSLFRLRMLCMARRRNGCR